MIRDSARSVATWSPTRVAMGSIGVGVAVLALKYLAYVLTGSVALFSDAMESIVNVAASIAALAAIRIAAIPPDTGHPYGHHKVEYFSAVIVGVLIVLSALAIVHSAYGAWSAPPPAGSMLGLALNAAAGLINGAWCVVLFKVAKSASSPALEADARHLLSDVISSGGVLLGVVLAWATGWWRLDVVLALLVAVNILWSGSVLLRSSVGALMDEAASPETRALLERLVAEHGAGAIQAHDVRTRRSGQATFIEFHLVVPGAMSVFDAHEICDRLERAINSAIPGARATIHVEPEHKAKARGVPLS